MAAENWNRHFDKFRRVSDPSVRRHTDLLLSAFLASRRSNLLAQPNYSGVAGRAKGKRHARALRTAFLKRRFPVSKLRRRILKRPAALLFKPRENLLRDRLCPTFLRDFKPMVARMKQRSGTSLDLKDFSFATNPAGTMAMLARLGDICSTWGDVRLNFVDACDDVTPYLVLSLLRSALPPVISGGDITMGVREVVEAVGIREALQINTIGRAGRQKAREEGFFVSAFPVKRRTPPGTFGDKDHQLRPQYKEYVADQFVDTINEWLGDHDIELIPEALGRFISAITEALDNAERHGDALDHCSEGEWSIAAFSKLVIFEGKVVLRCSIGIVSLGATISESLSSADEQITRAVKGYAKAHSPLFSQRQPEALHTVMALQDGVTRDRSASAARRGGVGFMELIEVIAELGDNDLSDQPSVFTIVSGRSCIRVTGAYRQGQTKKGAMRELWFNADNDPRKPPSREHVMTLDHEFPGVVLSACFTIDPEHLRKKLNDDGSDG
jgi:hypothetical protein